MSHITFQCPVSEDSVVPFSVEGKTFSSDPRLLAERNSQNAPPNKPSLSTFYFFSPHQPFKFYLVFFAILHFCSFVFSHLCFYCMHLFIFFLIFFFVFVLAQHSSLNVPPNQLRL